MNWIANTLPQAPLFATAADAASFIVDEVERVLRSALEEHERVGMLVAGATTYAQVYPQLANLDLPWERVTLFHTDARCVPDDSVASSNRLVREWLAHFSVRPAMVWAEHLEKPTIAADEYERKLVSFTEKYPLALALVGIGKDGHMASLFPKAMHSLDLTRLVISTEAEMEPFVPRISLTPKALDLAKVTICFIPNQEKRAALEKAASGVTLPIGLLPTTTRFILLEGTNQ